MPDLSAFSLATGFSKGVEMIRADVENILIKWLVDRGCEGLCNDMLACGCLVDDLAPCDGIQKDCVPAIQDKSYDGDEFDYAMIPKRVEL